MDSEKPVEHNTRKNVVLLGLVSFINDTSSKIIMPILPLFIAQIGGGGMALGIISGISDSLASFLKMFAGYWSDRAGKRKTYVISGYLVSSVAKLLFIFASQWPHVLALRVLERFGKGVRSAPRDALLAGSVEQKQRGRGFGIHRAMDSGGAVLGTLIAFGLFWFLGFSFIEIFAVAGVISFVSLVPLFFVRERARAAKKKPPSFSLRRLSPELKKFVTVAFLFALANFSYMFFVLRSQDAFSGEFAIAMPILLYAVYNLSYTLFAVPAGILSDTIGRRQVLLMGYGLFALVSTGFIFASSLTTYLILFVLYGLNYALVNANERAYVADLAEDAIRGTALGTYHMATSIATLPAGLAAGFLWELDPVYTFAFGAVLAVTAMAVLALGLGKGEADVPEHPLRQPQRGS
jgi:MFS family permease